MPDAAEPHPRPPSVDALARSIQGDDLPPPVKVAVARAAITAGEADRVEAHAEARRRALLQPVVNATGVLLHTNMGRAPLAHDQPAGYTNLELDLSTGGRGARSSHTGALLALAAGAEAALVVNNGAAAVLLALAALARGRGVAVSRGELVEIGGGFRVPEVMATSGARLVEVGTTNRTRLADYEAVLAPATDTADPGTDAAGGAGLGAGSAIGVTVVLKVHRSNYRIVGFTEETGVDELAGLGVPVVVDLGSGLLDAACPWLRGGPPAWLADEPAVRQTLAAGADLVTFSGDKLLGGPQAGIVAGRADLVAACARHPLARALRPGGLVLAALHRTARAYLDRDGDAIPFWRLATIPTADLRERAEHIADAVAAVVPDAERVGVVELASVPGGGTLPGVEVPSVGLALPGDRTAALRRATPAVIARVQEGRTLLDLRTVDPGDDDHLVAVLVALAGRGAGPG